VSAYSVQKKTRPGRTKKAVKQPKKLIVSTKRRHSVRAALPFGRPAK